jgi:hypothetical protein
MMEQLMDRNNKSGRYMLIGLIIVLGMGCSMGQVVPNKAETIPERPECPVCAPCSPLPVVDEQFEAPVSKEIYVLSMKEIQEVNQEPNYEIKAHFPFLEGAEGEDQFQNTVTKIIQPEIELFKQDLQAWREAEDLNISNSLSTLTIDYSVLNASKGNLSIFFNISVYYAGAAHPNSYGQVINFDLPDGKVLELSDLFMPDADYLGAISTYCREDLRQKGHLDFEEGTARLQDNFRNWNILGQEGLRISFDPYQVAPYAAGPQTVTIPYRVLKGMISSDGPLSRFAD